MSPKVRKYLKGRRLCKFKVQGIECLPTNKDCLPTNKDCLPASREHLPANNDHQVKPTSLFQEFMVGMIIPSHYGSYEILKEMAIGRCCEVYVSEYMKSRKKFALKVFIRNQHYRGALLRELKYLDQLSPHPNIVRPHEYFRYEARDVLIHELLSCTVKDVLTLHEGRRSSVWLVSTLALHLMKGLSHMHRTGIVHGDIKPHNIMWSGQEETFKLIDFGVSFTLTENIEHAVQSRAYQAPETILWNRWVQRIGGDTQSPNPPAPPKPGSRIDVWSAGGIVAEILLGKKIFLFGWNGEDVDESLESATQNLKEERDAGFLSNILPWIRKCLEEDVSERWSAEESERAAFLQNGTLERPSMFDLLVLPTRVLRVIGLVRPEMTPDVAKDLVAAVIQRASVYGGAPRVHKLDDLTGSLYLYYDFVQYSEMYFESLKRMTVKGYTLVVSYYPRRLYDTQIFY